MAQVLQFREAYETPRLDDKGKPIVHTRKRGGVKVDVPVLDTAYRWHTVGEITGGGHCVVIAEPNEAVVRRHAPDVNLIRGDKVKVDGVNRRDLRIPGSSAAGSPDIRTVDGDAPAPKAKGKKGKKPKAKRGGKRKRAKAGSR